MTVSPRPIRPSRREKRASQPQKEYLAIGQILAPRGLRGELKVRVETEDPARFLDLEHLYVGPDHARYGVRKANAAGAYVYLTLEGVSDRDAAESLRDLWLYVDEENALPLGEDEYYQHQIVGLAVRDEAGLELGQVTDVLETGANDVYVVAARTGELLLPAIKDVVLSIDITAGTMTVRIPEGLID